MKEVSTNNRVEAYSQIPIEDLFLDLQISSNGLNEKEVENQRNRFGNNELLPSNKDNVWHRLRRSFINPFSIVLFILAIISIITDILITNSLKNNYVTVIIIALMIIISGIIRFTQEIKSKKVTDELINLVDSEVNVYRDSEWKPISSEELVVGDIISLNAGDRVPADVRVMSSKDCFVSLSIINGESRIQEKSCEPLKSHPNKVTDYTNIAFMGSTITSGHMKAVVLAVGKDTAYGDFKVSYKKSKNGFDKGSSSIALVLIKFMAFLVPIVFIASGLTKGDWLAAFLFALSVAVGLTPELLPMVITACLAKGSSSMGKKETIVKNINAMQAFGSMDVLCVDKTGTLTNDQLILEYYIDVIGNESQNVLDMAYLNSYFHSGVDNQLDDAILQIYKYGKDCSHYDYLVNNHKKLDELPFDNNRRLASILVQNKNNNKIIVKGSINDVVNRCTKVRYKNKIIEMDENANKNVHAVVDEMLECGIKVLAIAEKYVDIEAITYDDEKDLTLIGYIAFFDAPKKSASSAIKKLKNLNVAVKVLTGDNIQVATSICNRLNIDTSCVITGAQFEALDESEAQLMVEKSSVFTELTPKQKAEIVTLLQTNGHSVGFLADGLNDISAVIEADVGISVDTAVSSVKKVSDVILMKKDLDVLEQGILEGRKSFANMSKYVKITASSNLGNIIAIVIASIFLPFFPMTSVQLLLLNLLYDILCLVLPWDSVDLDMLERPLEWSGRKLSRFMLCFGPISSIFDILTFAFLLFYLCPTICGGPFTSLSVIEQAKFTAIFQTGWFLESMWTQVLIIHLLRTKQVPMFQSRPSSPVLGVTILGILLFTFLVMTPVGEFIGLTVLPGIYFVFLIGIVLCYLLLVTLIKKLYVKKYNVLI